MNKNNSSGNLLIEKIPINHFLLIMRTTIFLLFTCVFCSMAELSYTQNARVTINKRNATIKEILNEIEKQTDYLFIYNDEINANEKVSVKAKQETVSSVLNSMLKDKDIKYSMEGNHIILFVETVDESAEDTNALVVQQQRILTGKVTDQNGEALPGATVMVKGTTQGTITDADGNYSLSNVPDNATLVFSFVGMKTQELVVGSQTTINVQMEEEAIEIEEVVAVGYGVQRKITATNSVSTVAGEELNKISTVNTSKALQGMAPGITIIDRGGAPGSDDPEIFIRGVGTTGNSSPLVLVDGVEMSLGSVPAQEIENISILKDAASTSIYGSRAAHGVILVTTKRGVEGKMRVTYNGFVGLQDLAVRPRQVSATEYMDMVNEASINAGGSIIYTDAMKDAVINGTDPDHYSYNNYVDEVFKSNYITEHSVSLTGGNQEGRYLISFDYIDQPAITDNTDFQRYSYRMNADLNVGELIKVSSDLTFRHTDRLWPERLGYAQYRAFAQPLSPIKYSNGNYALDQENNNAVAGLDLNVVGKDKYKSDNLIGQVKTEFEPIKDLVFTGTITLNSFWDKRKVHNKNHKFYDENNDYVTQWNAQNGVSDRRSNSYEMTLRFLANYQKKFSDKHGLNFLYGMEQISYKNSYSMAERKNLISDALPEVSLGSASSQYASGLPSQWGINSFFGRFNYSYKEKYLFETNIRADGSSKFAKGNKWGFFPSFSAAWRLSEESFFESIGFVDQLKLRASWGQTGNEAIGDFLYLNQYDVEDVVMDGVTKTGVRQSQMSNPEVTWETVETLDIGIDFNLFNNKLFGELDFYSKDTKDILLNLAIPKFLGLNPPPQNAGVVRNSGFETMLGFRKVDGDFNFSTSLNFSYNNNKWIDRRGDTNIDGWNIQKEGFALNSFYIYQADGLIANDEELANYKSSYTSDPRGMSVLKAGDVKLVDVDGNGTIDPDDRQVFKPNIPKFSFGMNLNAEYKNFDLSLLLQGSMGANKFFYGELYEGPSYEVFTGIHFRDRWTEENQNPNASVPRLEAANNRNMSTYNSFYLRDVSYVRLKNAQLGYTFPDKVADRLMIGKLRIYVSGNNLFTISGLDQGIDPESPSGRPGSFPPLRIINFGVNVDF